jgi:hypothetical protein
LVRVDACSNISTNVSQAFEHHIHGRKEAGETEVARNPGALSVLAVAGSGQLGTVPASGQGAVPTPSQQTLHSLAARHDLYVGTAVDMSALDDDTDTQYRSLISSSPRSRQRT